MNMSDELERLHRLHQSGALTEAEYAQAKQRLLNGAAPQPAPSSNAAAEQFNKLRRSVHDRWIGGVCGGLGKMTGLESWIWRLIFALAFLCGGAGVLVYVLAWIF
ncbi:MAG TPA: PspC domain-containing protein, partial [Burkholderiaceae bacterium]